MSADYRIKDNSLLTGKQYTPGSASEGCDMLCTWCQRCARDKPMRDGADFDECGHDEVCEIISDSFIGSAVEWREMPDGTIKCLAFTEYVEPVPMKDDKTIDMFGSAA